jgi:signal transduction histidine kinase
LKRSSIILAVCWFSHTLIAQTAAIDSLKMIAENHPKDSIGLNTRLNLVFELTRINPQQALYFAHQAASAAQALGKENKLCGAYGYLVTLHQAEGRLDSAFHYLNLQQTLVARNHTNKKIALNFNQTAGLFYKNQGQYSKALPYALEALKLSPPKTESYAGQLLNVGNIFFYLGKYKESVDHHLQALTVFEELGSKRGISFCLQSLGGDFFKLKQWSTSKEYFSKSLSIKEELNDKRGMVNALSGIADVYKEQRQFDRAQELYDRAIRLAQELKLVLEEARCQHQVGLLHKQMKQPANALSSFTKAQKLARQAGDSTLSATVGSEIITLTLEEKKLEASLMTNLNTFIATGDRSSEALEYYRLSEYYYLNKHYDKAYEYLIKHVLLRDSLEGNAVILQLATLKEQYEGEKKEKEIELLKKDQELQALALSRERANKTIISIALISVVIISLLLVNRFRVMSRLKRQAELEKMRQNIARDLHDSIGSTLSSINIISQMALKDANGSTSHFQRIAQHSSSMMESMSDIVWSINPNNDSLRQVISKMKEFAAEILDPLDVMYTFSGEENLQNLTLDVSTRKNLFLIFKEAINNAAKYSSASTIKIHFKKENGSIWLSIQDNGKGFDVQENSSGNGLRNMQARAENVHGKLDLKSNRDGTEIMLSFPIT